MNVKWSRLIDLNEGNVRLSVPRSAGVYLLCVKMKDGKWRCFYTGQAENLEERLLQHVSLSETNQCIRGRARSQVCGMYFARVENERDRNGAEKYLYDYYSPECNLKDPGGIPITVNTPR